jgi:electron transfer flavoprotein beta subunit
MKIVVCVKFVPLATAERHFLEDGTVDRGSVDGVLSELDEYAVEAALQIREAGADAEVVVLTMGPEQARTAYLKGLQMGADAAVHVSDEAIHGSDAAATSLVLARALERTGFDLVICGMASTDGGMSVLPAMLAERLGAAQLTFAADVSVDGSQITVRRDGDVAVETIAATLPAVVSVTDQANEPRYPSFKGIMAAKKKPVTMLTLADLGVDAGDVGLGAAWTSVESVERRPPRSSGTVVADYGTGADQLVEFLAAGKFI